MNVIVFAGPTIAAADARRILDVTYLPPVRQGDVYRACRGAPTAIGIIDGYFDRVPAVWHKEILHAMEMGVHVFGGASMGALRAAELEAFGMVGVGAVFEAFRSGQIEDDDEVAVAHGSPADGYRVLSEAAVNVRATLAAAITAGVIGTYGAQGLLAATKALPYEQRSYPAIVEAAARRVPAPDLARFAAWWPTGRVDQKRRDAIAVLEALKALIAENPRPKQVDYVVEPTDAWREAREPLRQMPLVHDDTPAGDMAILEELQISGEYPAMYAKAFTRALVLENRAEMEGRARSAELNDALARFCDEQGVAQGEGLWRWREREGLEDDDDFTAFVQRQADVYRAELLFERDARHSIADQLRLGGRFGRLRERAEQKRAILRQALALEPTLSDTNMSEDDLWAWYFREVLRTDRPASLQSAARDFGFEDVRSFRAAVIRERLFRQQPAASDPSRFDLT